MKEKITPVGLKGYEITERMKQLMGVTPINENRKTSVIELTKEGPDGKIYGIVRENHEYYIKTANTDKKHNLVAEDFGYIGGLKNKKDFAYHSYAKAIKHLNLKFNSLNESLGKLGQINVFEDDNLQEVSKKSSCCDANIYEDKCSECGTSVMNEAEETKNNPWAICTASVGREDKAKYEKCVKDVKKEKGVKEEITESEFEEASLSEVEQAVEDMLETEEKIEEAKKPEKHRLSISRSLSDMDSIIESIQKPNKKKVYTLK